MLLDVRFFCLQGLYERPGDPQNLIFAFDESFGVLRSCIEPRDPFRAAPGSLQGAQGRVENRALVSCLGEHPAYWGHGQVVGTTGFFGDLLLERECRVAGPALVCPAQDDDEHLVPVAKSVLPAVREPLPDPLEEGITRDQTVVPDDGGLHRQNSNRPAVGELLAQNAVQRCTVRQPCELVQPARGVSGFFQCGTYSSGEELQDALFLGAVLTAPDDHSPPLLVFARTQGYGHKAIYPMDFLLAAHDFALAATLQHETLNRGVPPTGTDVEIAFQYGLVMVAFQGGDVRVRPATHCVGRLHGPTEDAFQAQDLHNRPELREQPLVALHAVFLVCQVGGESASEAPGALHLGAQERDGRAEQRYQAGSQDHGGGTERADALRGSYRGRVAGHQRGRRHHDFRPRFDPGYPQRREEVKREEG